MLQRKTAFQSGAKQTNFSSESLQTVQKFSDLQRRCFDKQNFMKIASMTGFSEELVQTPIFAPGQQEAIRSELQALEKKLKDLQINKVKDEVVSQEPETPKTPKSRKRSPIKPKTDGSGAKSKIFQFLLTFFVFF